MSSLFRKAARFVFGRLLPRTAYPVISGPLKGTKFILGGLAGEGGGASVYFNGIEPEQTAAMIDAIRPGSTVFDIGANAGYYTMLASRLTGNTGRVAALEPLPRNLAFLQRHVELNRADNVLVLPFACSDQNGTASFEFGENTAMGKISEAAGGGQLSLLVATSTLNSLSSATQLRPDVIKIDVEGAELQVLKGGEETLRTCRPVIFLSTHSAQLRSDCLAFLKALDYDTRPLIADADPHEFLCLPPAAAKS